MPQWAREFCVANPIAAEAIGVGLLLVVAVLLLVVLRLIVLPIVRRVIKRADFEWGQVFVDHKFFRRLSMVPGALVLDHFDNLSAIGSGDVSLI